MQSSSGYKVLGFVYLGAAVALLIHTEWVLMVADYRVHISSIICMFGLALMLIVIAIIGLFFVRTGPKKIAAVSTT